MNPIQKKKIKYAYIYILFITLSALGFFLIISNIYNNEVADYKKKKIGDLNLAYNVLINSYEKASQIVFNEIIDKPEIWQILKRANSRDQEVVSGARQALLLNLSPTYERLKELNFRQFHFQLPNNVSFLRFHRPHKFGDDLTDIRYSIKMTNLDLKSHIGFEEGRIFNGFRYVFPIVTDLNRHLGSVEVSVGFKSIEKDLSKLFPKDYYFLICKKIVSEKVFASEKKKYKEAYLHEKFMYEDYIEVSDIDSQINKKIKKQIEPYLKEFKPTAVDISHNNVHYIVTFYPISNVEGKKIAYIASYEKDDTIAEIYKAYYATLLVLFLFFILISVLLFKLNKKNRHLSDSEQRLITSEKRLIVLNKIIRHDLSNDFAVIKSAIRLYKNTSDQSMLEEIEKRVKRSIDAIASYRKYEVIINSSSDLNVLEISELINETIIEFPNISFNIKDSCDVLADDALYSVFLNLIANSVKHGGSSKIDIEITSNENDCEIVFSDNGMGIPEEIKSNIFDEGYTYGESGNTGIGLYIVKQTIERYNGSISVEDNKPTGSTFIINLKRAIV